MSISIIDNNFSPGHRYHHLYNTTQWGSNKARVQTKPAMFVQVVKLMYQQYITSAPSGFVKKPAGLIHNVNNPGDITRKGLSKHPKQSNNTNNKPILIAYKPAWACPRQGMNYQQQ